MKLQDLRIGTRIWFAVGVFITVLLALIAFTAWRSAQLQAESDEALTLAETKIRTAARWAGLTEAAVARAQAGAISSDNSVRSAFKETNDKAIAQITELQKQLKELPQTEAETAQMAKIAADRKVVLDLSAAVNKLKEAGDQEGARTQSLGPFGQAVDTYMQSLRGFVTLQEQAAQATRERLAAERRKTVLLACAVVALLIVAALVGTVALVGSIRRPLGDAMALAQAIAGGDLSPRPAVQRGDEMGDLMRALQTMTAALGRVVQQVHTASDSIRTASAEIATGNQDLSARTEQTASSLQQTASSMEQLTGTVKQSADSARQANQLASSAAEVAARGGSVVSQVVSTMDEINSSSKKISDIIGVIDGIAFQTNILALNAAVEAARAGEQGRGFAVVAGEVRSLAQRSAQAAKEIKALIGASVEKVDSGSRLVADAGQTMQEIVGSVQRVSDIIGEITAASSEQSDGIGQVNSAVTQLDQMTQQNAALVEESAAAAESLRDQAQRLAAVVATFRLESGGPGLAPAVPSAPVMSPPPVKPVAAAPSKPVVARAPAKPKPATIAPAVAAAPAPTPTPAPESAPVAKAAPNSGFATTAPGDDWETF